MLGRAWTARTALAVVLAVATVAFAGPAAAQASTGTIRGIAGPTSPFPGVPHACVHAFDLARQPVGTETSADPNTGSWELTLPAGGYYVLFVPCGTTGQARLPELYDDSRDWSTATPVTVTAGRTTVLALTMLEDRGRMAGRVVDQFGQGVPCAVLSHATGPDPIPYDAATTDADGDYVVNGRVGIDGNGLAFDCGAAYGTALAPQVVTIPPGPDAQPVADVVVQQPDRSVSGTVGSAGRGAGTSCVAAVAPNGEFLAIVEATPWDEAFPRASHWIIPDLPPGPVRIGFFDCGTGAPAFAPEWYEDAPDFADATDVVVEADGAVHGIHGDVTPYTALAMDPRDAEGERVHGICMWVTDPTGTVLVAADYVEEHTTGHAQVVPGDYKVLFSDCGGGWAAEWYEDAPDAASASVVRLDGSGGPIPQPVLAPV